MLFKSARFYRLTEVWNLSTAELCEKLAALEFQPCGSLDPLRYGFVEPVEGSGFAFESKSSGCVMVCAKRQEKILPGAVIKDLLAEKVGEIKQSECRPVGRKERYTLKDEIIFSLLPKAFTRSSLDYAYIDPVEGFIVVNASSAKRAEDLLSKLREALGSLRCWPISTVNIPRQVLTGWVRGRITAPRNFDLGASADFEAAKSGGEVRFKGVDLASDEVVNHINNGFVVSKLSLVWRESVSFSLDDCLAFRGIKFGDSIADKANSGNPESRLEQFAADFGVMTIELRALANDVIAAHGGLDDGD